MGPVEALEAAVMAGLVEVLAAVATAEAVGVPAAAMVEPVR